MFGSDEFLDAHVGSHFEDAGIESGPVVESPRQSSSKESNKVSPAALAAGERRQLELQSAGPDDPPDPLPQVPWGQGVSAQRRKEQREAQRAHQQISVGSVGMNKALVASPNTKVRPSGDATLWPRAAAPTRWHVASRDRDRPLKRNKPTAIIPTRRHVSSAVCGSHYQPIKPPCACGKSGPAAICGPGAQGIERGCPSGETCAPRYPVLHRPLANATSAALNRGNP